MKATMKITMLIILCLALMSFVGCSGCAGEDGADGADGAAGLDGQDADDADDDIADDTDDTGDDDVDDTGDDDVDDTSDDTGDDDDDTTDDTVDDDTSDDTGDDDTSDDTGDDTGDDDTAPDYTFDGVSEIFDVVIDEATDSATTTVYFAIAEESGAPLSAMTSSQVRFGLAKLTLPDAGNSGQWVSYINRTEVKDPGEPGTTGDGTTAFQATTQTCNTSGGVFTNYGDGTYSYQFSFDITAVTSPVAVEYEPQLVHRVAMQYTGNTYNAILDFKPDGSDVGDTREIFNERSCNECHTQLAFHGGGRITGDYCVVCHNPGTTDANSGNVLDMSTMVHKIHMGEELTYGYTIWGNSNSEHDYSEIVYPQDHRRCTKCHDASDADTPQAGNWVEYPTRASCGACHDNVVFTSHYGGQTTDENCLSCHYPGYMNVEESHEIPMDEWTAKFEYHILEITNTGQGETPVVTFSVTNPSDGDSNWNIKSGPEWTTASCSSLNLRIAMSTTDYTNPNNPTSVTAQPVSKNAVTTSVDNGDGTFSVTFTGAGIPADATGSGIVYIDGRPCGDLDGDSTYSDRIVVPNVHAFFAITDDDPVEHRQVVSIEKCDACHDLLSLHGGNRNDNIDVCLSCHNPRATDVGQRPASVDTTPADGTWDNPSALGIDGLHSVSINFKYMIHAIHAGDMREYEYVVYGYGRNPVSFGEVVFPGTLSQCTMCHLDETYGMPLPDGVLSNTMDTGPIAGTSDDTFIQAGMAACYACHDSDLAYSHMEQMGGVDGAETCVYCHGVGKAYDVYTVHSGGGGE